jgi:hypothetical protein
MADPVNQAVHIAGEIMPSRQNKLRAASHETSTFKGSVSKLELSINVVSV